MTDRTPHAVLQRLPWLRLLSSKRRQQDSNDACYVRFVRCFQSCDNEQEQ